MIEERDIIVAMRDGTRLAVDVYRPDKPGKYPVRYAAALHNKDIQGPDLADILPPQPAHAPLWFGPIEAGDTRRFIANGYVHVIAQPRGSAKSEGHYGHEDTDHYDLIEWITQQPWSNGKVGMVGISGYAGEQWRAAAQGHPALKAIFPYDACSAYGGMFGFRDFNPGGVLHTFPYLLDVFSTVHESRDRPAELPPAEEELWRRAMRNPDFKQYINLYNILTQKGQRTFIMYLMMTATPGNSMAPPNVRKRSSRKSEYRSTRAQEPMLIPTSSIGSVRSIISRTSMRRRNCFSPDQLTSSGHSINITTRSSAGMTIG